MTAINFTGQRRPQGDAAPMKVRGVGSAETHLDAPLPIRLARLRRELALKNCY